MQAIRANDDLEISGKLDNYMLAHSTSRSSDLSTPNLVQEDIPLLQKMRASIHVLRERLTAPDFRRGPAARAANRFRAQLMQVYGPDSPQMTRLPVVRLEEYSTTDVKPELVRRLELGESILNTLDVMIGLGNGGRRIFIGHGRSPIWRELKDFIQDRLSLPWDEFNREVVAGIGTSDRLQTMLNSSSFAFLVMTAEEEHFDSTVHARPNVIHEVGLFQGKLGMRRAIVLLEEGCSEFSNIVGLGQIRFPKGNISVAFEDIRRVLERENVV